MAGTGPGDLHALAVAILGVAAESLDTIPSFEPHLEGAPDRQLVSPGLPVDDCCPQLAVHVESAQDADTSPSGLPAGKRDIIGKINHVTIIVRATRCVPSGVDSKGNYSTPSVEELEAAAEQINADGWALWNHIYNLKADGELLSLCSELFFDGLVSIPPQGACGGWTLTLRARLDGYIEPIGS